MILYEYSEIAPYLPQPGLGLPPAPPPVPSDVRGVAIHWWTFALPSGGPAQRHAPGVPVRTWSYSTVPFSALSLDRTDRAPETTIERDRYVRLAAAIVAAHTVIPEPRTLLYEVRA